MSIIKFISETKLKEFAGINGNIDNKEIQPLIVEAQILYIEPIIGTGIYNELRNQIQANTLTALNINLLDNYIVPCLVAYIKFNSPLELLIKFTNKNVSVKNSENSTPISLDDARYFMDNLKNKAEVYAERITKFLLENSTSYPLYFNPGNGLDTVYPLNNNFTTGMVLDSYCHSCRSFDCGCCGKIFKG